MLPNKKSALHLGSLQISPPLFLAPMAGLTHLALRRIIAEMGGCGLFSTEMLSSRRLPSENPTISPFLIKTELETPLSYQFFTTGIEEIPGAIDAIHRFGADSIDLNLGCPAPNIRKIGAGAELMDNPQLTRDIVKTARKLTDLPLTVKIRLGSKLDEKKLRDFCLLLEGEGIDLLTVHGRLKGESFHRVPRWDWIGKVKKWLSIPVIANGGIKDKKTALRCLEMSGADGLMIGREAIIRPWIFVELAREVYGCDIPLPQINPADIHRRFSELLETHYRPERRLGRLKEFSHYFQANYAFGHSLASAVQSSPDFETAVERAEEFFERNV